MRRIHVLVLMFVVCFSMNISAKEMGSQVNFSDYLMQYEEVKYPTAFTVDTGATDTTFTRSATVINKEDEWTDTYTFREFYTKASNGKWVHTKTERNYYYDNELTENYVETFYVDQALTSNCSASTSKSGLPSFNCVVRGSDAKPATKTYNATGFEEGKVYSTVYLKFSVNAKSGDINKGFGADLYESKIYHSNGKLFWYTKGVFKNGKINTDKSFEKGYNSKGKVVNKIVFRSSGFGLGHWAASKHVAYYSNGKVKATVLNKFNSNNQHIFTLKYTYSTSGKKSNGHLIKYNKKGVANVLYSYKFNKAGQLKSNKKYGTAYKIKSNVKNEKITASYKAKYNSKGKLGKVKKINLKKKSIYSYIGQQYFW